jgi:hypothetical protein
MAQKTLTEELARLRTLAGIQEGGESVTEGWFDFLKPRWWTSEPEPTVSPERLRRIFDTPPSAAAPVRPEPAPQRVFDQPSRFGKRQPASPPEPAKTIEPALLDRILAELGPDLAWTGLAGGKDLIDQAARKYNVSAEALRAEITPDQLRNWQRYYN